MSHSVSCSVDATIWYAVCFCPRSVDSSAHERRGAETSTAIGLVRYSQTRLVTLTSDSPAGVTEPSAPGTTAPSGKIDPEEPPEPPPAALASLDADAPAVDELEHPEDAIDPPSMTITTVRNQEVFPFPDVGPPTTPTWVTFSASSRERR